MAVTLAHAQASKTLTRNLEPVVRNAEELLLDEFDGVPVDQIIAYRYTSTGNSWSRIPLQIDQKAYKDLSNFIHCVPDYSPDCACEDPPTCEEVVCEETYVWEGENDPDDSGGTANVLDGNDVIVFLAKDTGDQALTSNFPSGISILERYEIQVRNPEDLTTGYIYLFRLSSSQSPYSPGYMTYTRDPQTEEAVISGNCVNNLIGFDTYRLGLSSNWTVHELKTTAVADNGSGQALCTDFSQRTDVLDHYKWRMKIQTEETWNNTSSYMGDISGPVRIVRGSVGARSGYGTTRYTSAYPTFYEEEIHLRVHALEQGNIKTYHDYNTLSFTPGQETPCPGSDFEAYLAIPSDSHLDDVDGCPTTFPTLVAYTPKQLNGAHASIAEVFAEDPKHPIPPDDIQTRLAYADRSDLSDAPEDESGRYGNIGSMWIHPNSTEEKVCPGDPPDQDLEHWAGISRINVFSTSGQSNTLAQLLNKWIIIYPLEVTSEHQTYSGGSSSPNPCIVTLSTNNPGNGFRADGSFTPCNGTNNDGLWAELYRAGATGPFSRHRDLRRSFEFSDFSVEEGQTYRYYIKTYNASGQRSQPSSISTITISDTIPPTIPTILGNINGTTITLSWDFASDYDIAGYDIYRSPTPGGPYAKLTVSGALRTSSYATQIPGSGNYYYVVKAVDSSGLESLFSNELSFSVN